MEQPSNRVKTLDLLPCLAGLAPKAFHEDCKGAVARAAAKLGYSSMPVVSGAGHDAVYMAKLAPTGMIFIPCLNGISHNEIESATPEHSRLAAMCCCTP